MQQYNRNDGLDFLLLVPLGHSPCCPYPEPCAPGWWGSQRNGVPQTNHLGEVGDNMDIMDFHYMATVDFRVLQRGRPSETGLEGHQ